MAGIELATAQTHLDLWLAADLAVADAQDYTIAGRSLTMADAEDIRKNITHWNSEVKRLTRGGIRIRGATPTG